MRKKEPSGIPITIKDGMSFEWGCCGCGLVHHVHVRTHNKTVTLRVFTDEYSTYQWRRRKK